MEILKNIMKDENGYGVIELMVIMAALGAIAGTVFTTLEGDNDSGLKGAAGEVNSKITDQLGNW